MIKKISISIFFLFFFSICNAEIINKIEIAGNDRVSKETIVIYGKIKINKNYDEEDLNKIFNNLYSTDFFENITLKISSGILKITLVEYPAVNQLILIGEKSGKIKDEIKKLILTKEKKSFIKPNLSKDINLIKKIYSSMGYNNSTVETKIKVIDKNNLDLFIEVNRGNQTKISSINFIGDKKLRDRRLRDVIASEEDNFWKVISRNTKFTEELINLDMRLLTNYYKSLGYYDVEITSNTAEINKEGNIDLIYSIDAGNRYRINKIFTNADPVFDTEIFYSLKKSYSKNIGKFYSPFIVKDLLEEIDELILNNNLQFVQHNVEETIQGDQIQIKFNIFESEKILVERVNITGNSITNEDVIRAELLLDEGDPFTLLNLKKSISKLKARNIFREVKYTVSEGSQNNLKTINVDVEEKPTGEISAGAGVGTNGGSFAFSISENNWLGEGKKLNFSMDIDAESLSGVLNFTDPNYNFLGNSINYYVSSESSDRATQGYENSILSTGINTSFEQYKDLFAIVGISASYDDLRTNSSATASLKKQDGNFSEIAGNYGFKYDKRNQAFMPTSGSVISFNQKLPFYADKQSISNTITSSSYKTITENVIGAGKFYISAINGIGDDKVRISKRKTISQRRLRGFKKGKVGPVDGDDHIGGNYVSAVNLEAQLPNFFPESSRTELGIFLDAGNVWGVDYDASLDDSNTLRSSAGAALSWLSPVGPMSFVFSTNISKASTDETEGFNFNLGTTF